MRQAIHGSLFAFFKSDGDAEGDNAHDLWWLVRALGVWLAPEPGACLPISYSKNSCYWSRASRRLMLKMVGFCGLQAPELLENNGALPVIC
jgi:hypothetical protein